MHVPETYTQARNRAVWWTEPVQGLLDISGPDAGKYLQTQLTQDLENLPVGEGAPAALVDRKAHLRALMLACRQDSNRYWLLPEAGTDTLLEHLDAFHFIEDVTVSALEGWVRLRLEGPASFEILHELSGQDLSDRKRWSLRSLAIPGGSVWVIPDSLSGESGMRLVLRETYAETLKQQLQDLGVQQVTAEALQILRLEAGYPEFGIDMDTETQLPETGLEKQTVNYDKGCYLGQEVIARIRTYGVVPRALIGLELDVEPLAAGPLKLECKAVGRLTSWAWSPQRQSWIALAYVHKKHREGGVRLSLSLETGDQVQALNATVRRLPFYTPPSAAEQAQILLEEALGIFAESDESQAVPLLEAAISKDPMLADAYESLGVILSRLGRHDEAISVMLRLTEVAPEEPMAHTNLSRFFMLQGDKDTAEKHMGEATRLNMLRTQQQMQAAQLAAREKAQKQEMLEMFKEVLETEDPDDLVANFGLGKALLDLEQPSEALSYLEKATRIEPLYSAAWLQWGKALTQVGDKAKAREVFAKGIEAASEKGDLMPLKEMETRLAALV